MYVGYGILMYSTNMELYGFNMVLMFEYFVYIFINDGNCMWFMVF